MLLSGTINHDGNLDILNGIEGNVDRNNSMKAMDITGNINQQNGDANITNYAAGGLNVAAGAEVNTEDLTMLNTGAGGLTINGNARNNGTARVTNKAGALNIGGSFVNNGDATILNDGTRLTVSGTVNNEMVTL